MPIGSVDYYQTEIIRGTSNRNRGDVFPVEDEKKKGETERRNNTSFSVSIKTIERRNGWKQVPGVFYLN